MTLWKKLILLKTLLITANVVFAAENIDWPIPITIDTRYIDYGSKQPVALVCDYIADSYPAGANVTYWVSLQSEQVWIRPDTINSVKFDFKSREHLGQGHVYQQLRCQAQWQKPNHEKFSFICSKTAPGSVINVADAIKTGQCTVTS